MLTRTLAFYLLISSPPHPDSASPCERALLYLNWRDLKNIDPALFWAKVYEEVDRILWLRAQVASREGNPQEIFRKLKEDAEHEFNRIKDGVNVTYYFEDYYPSYSRGIVDKIKLTPEEGAHLEVIYRDVKAYTRIRLEKDFGHLPWVFKYEFDETLYLTARRYPFDPDKIKALSEENAEVVYLGHLISRQIWGIFKRQPQIREMERDAVIHYGLSRQRGGSIWTPLIGPLQEAIWTLASLDQKMIEMHLKGWGEGPISAKLGISLHKVRTRIKAIKEELRLLLPDPWETEEP